MRKLLKTSASRKVRNNKIKLKWAGRLKLIFQILTFFVSENNEIK